MKKFLLPLLLIGLFGCKKSGNPTPGLSGKYSAYKEVDTTYNPTDLLVETLTGDTAYFNYGTPDFEIIPNTIGGYDASYLADTLTFVSNTSGYESGVGYGAPNHFSYSIATGFFDDGDNFINDTTSLTFKITQINPTTIKLLAEEKNGSVVEDRNASYYRKL
jgi:hypothetical protein